MQKQICMNKQICGKKKEIFGKTKIKGFKLK